MHASQVSKNRRLLQCICAIFWCLLSGGPIFGFAALKPILVKSHVYEYMCDVSINSSSLDYLEMFTIKPEYFVSPTTQLFTHTLGIELSSNEIDLGVAHCTPQDLKLNMMFTVGAVLTNVSALVIGRVLDVYGPRVCGMIGAIFLYIACFIFIFNKSLIESFTWFDPYLVGYACMALGGPFCFISSFQLSNSFPERSGTILALLTGAFDTSLAVFLIYRMIYNGTNGSFTLDRFFAVYLAVPIFISLAQVLIMPGESYKTGGDLCLDDDIVSEPHHHHEQQDSAIEEGPSETDALLNRQEGRRDSIGDALKQPYVLEGEERLVEYSGGVFGILHGYSAEFQLKTKWFYLLCLFATIQMLRLNYFVATINSQYTYLFGSVKQAEKLTQFFDVALPLGGVILVPFVGMLLDNYSTVVVLAVLLMISLAIGILQLWGNFVAAILTVMMFVAYRPFFYTAISDFCAKIFGFDTFGTVYGSIICISGIFNFGQSLLDEATHTKFGMNPTPINGILVATTAIIGGVTWSYVYQQAKVYNAKRLSASHV